MADQAPVEADLRTIQERLSYDPVTGVIRWKTSPTLRMPAGSEAGCLDGRGYRLIRVNKRLYTAHRLAWALHYGAWPAGDLDHKNRNKGDNRIENLRLAPRSRNIANSPARNDSGLPKGCYQLKGRRRWYSQIHVNGVLRKLGTFATAEEAAAAFRQAHQETHGDFSHCDVR